MAGTASPPPVEQIHTSGLENASKSETVWDVILCKMEHHTLLTGSEIAVGNEYGENSETQVFSRRGNSLWDDDEEEY